MRWSATARTAAGNDMGNQPGCLCSFCGEDQPLTEPWTFESFEIYPQAGWEIYDPNQTRVVAVFYNRTEAESYLEWRNEGQVKLRARKHLDPEMDYGAVGEHLDPEPTVCVRETAITKVAKNV